MLFLSAAIVPGAVQAQALDTVKLDQARSAVAEVLVISRAQARGQVTAIYADGLREGARNNLKKLLRDPDIKDLAGEALRALDARDETALCALQERLTALERAHGRGG
jgi:hypothetical protein